MRPGLNGAKGITKRAKEKVKNNLQKTLTATLAKRDQAEIQNIIERAKKI